jgi:hypothetical protein
MAYEMLQTSFAVKYFVLDVQEVTVAVELILQKQDIIFMGGMKHLPSLSPVNVETSRLICMTEGGQMNAVSKLIQQRTVSLKLQALRLNFHVSFRN